MKLENKKMEKRMLTRKSAKLSMEECREIPRSEIQREEVLTPKHGQQSLE